MEKTNRIKERAHHHLQKHKRVEKDSRIEDVEPLKSTKQRKER